jgi:chromosomal replication initiator protein
MWIKLLICFFDFIKTNFTIYEKEAGPKLIQHEMIWKNIVEDLSLELDQKSLGVWFSQIKIKTIENNFMTFESPNRFTTDWILKNYSEELIKSVYKTTGKNLKLKFEINKELQNKNEKVLHQYYEEKPAHKTKSVTFKNPAKHGVLNDNLTFDSFIVGRSNQFAHAASLAVAERNARNYNPLFIYGGVGLGKTHLLHAVGNSLKQKNRGLRVICIQAESFMNEMIVAIRHEKMEEFRKQYRQECDVLLMDDIEILAGKERTQEEFFYTFNDLYTAGKKIIITSDKFPKEMITLEERLRSRFEMGILVDIQPPEFETRLAILKYKAEKEKIALPDDVAMFMAEKIKSNIRKLSGCLIRLSAAASLSGSNIDIKIAEDIIQALVDENEANLNSDYIIRTVAPYFKIKVSDIKSKKRNRKYTVPRQIAMYLCRELCTMSYPEIGNSFGGRDHSTVIHSVKKIGIEINTNFEMKRHIETLTRQLKTVG